MKTAVVTDTNSGITAELGKELGVYVVPMPVMIDGKTYYEGVNLTQEAFFSKSDERWRYHHISAVSRRCDGIVGQRFDRRV